MRRQNRYMLLISILIACSFFKKYSWTRWHQFIMIFFIILFSPVFPITLRYAIKIQIIVFYQIFHFMLLMIMSKGRIWCADHSQCLISTCFLPVLGKALITKGQLSKFSVWDIIWFIHSLIFPTPPPNFVAWLCTPSFKYNLLLSCGESCQGCRNNYFSISLLFFSYQWSVFSLYPLWPTVFGKIAQHITFLSELFLL